MKIHTKRRKANNNEPWIGELLDEVSEDKLLEMSAIPTDIPLPLPNQEKLARTVIDKADVFDEQERVANNMKRHTAANSSCGQP